MRNLKLPKSGCINKIIHLSDLHIRNGDENLSRYSEYSSVFSNLYKKIETYDEIRNNSAVVVITGDTFHHKCKIESPGILLFNSLIYKLSNLAPVYIILGNHDFKQDQSVTIDFLKAFLDNSMNSNVEYLNETGLYKAGNIGFGLVDIKDALHLGSGAGISENLVKFPSPDFDESVHTKIALFHGTMNSSKLNEFREANNGYSWEWLDVGYDLALLGDIHKHQVFIKESGLIAAYAGSLIQQNFGENIRNHGLLEWNLSEDSTKWNLNLIEIQNDYGLLKLNFFENKWFYEGEPFEKLINWSLFPRNVKIRIQGDYSIFDLQKLEKILQFRSVNYEIEDYFVNNDLQNNLQNDHQNDTQNNSIYQNITNLNDNVDERSIFKFMKENNIYDYTLPTAEMFNIDLDTLGNEIKNVMNKKNTEFLKEFEKYTLFLESINKKNNIRIGILEWSGLLCYNDRNWFDFEKINEKTNLLSGSNASGKTSFLEILNIALFGKSIPSRKTRSFSKSIICNSKTKNINSYTKVNVFIRNEKYQIVRVFDNEGKPKQRGGGLFKFTEENEEKLEKQFSDSSRLNIWISENIGDQDYFLMTNMLTQNNDNDILNLNQKDQREHLEKVVGITKITKEVCLYKLRLNQYKQIACLIRNSLETLKDNIHKDGIEIDNYKNVEENSSTMVKTNLILDRKELNNLKEQKKNYEKNLKNFNLIRPDNLFDFDNLSECQLEDLNLEITSKLKKLEETIESKYEVQENIIKKKFVIDDKYAKYLKYPVNEEDKKDMNKVKLEVPVISKEDCYNNIKTFDIFKKELYEIVSGFCDTNSLSEYQIDEVFINASRLKNDLLIKNNITFDKIKNTLLDLTDRAKIFQDQSIIGSKTDKDVSAKIECICQNIEKISLSLNDSEYKGVVKPNDTLECLLDIKSKFEKLIQDNQFLSNEDIVILQDRNDGLNQEITENEHRLKEIEIKIKSVEEKQLDMKDLSIILEINLKKLSIEKTGFEKRLHLCSSDVYENIRFLEENKSSMYIKKELKEGIYKKLNEYSNLKETIQSQSNDIHKLKETIQKLETNIEKHPYNPQCEACRKQPVRLQINEYVEELNDTLNKKESNQLILETILPNKYDIIYDKYNKLNNVIEKYYMILENKDEFYKFRDCLKNLESQTEHLEAIQTILKCFRDNINLLNEEFNILSRQNISLNNELHSIKNKISKHSNYLINYDIWNERLQYAIKNIYKWEDYEKDQLVYKKIKDVSQLRNDLELLKNYRVYLKEKVESENEFSYYTNEIQTLEDELRRMDICYTNYVVFRIKVNEAYNYLKDWNVYEEQLDKNNIVEYLRLKNEIVKLESYDLLETKFLNLKKYQLFLVQCQEKEDIELKLSKLNDLIIEKEVKLQLSENLERLGRDKIEKYLYFLEKLNEVDKLILNLDFKIKTLNQYRSKTFERVIPLLENYTNRLLSSIDKNLKVICTVFEDGLFKFSAFNGSFQIPIEKTSGFEKSIISLCLRLAFIMLTLGPAKKCGQLFIDEAFVNCDQNHLSKIPDFLSYILNFFESILLVSHIDIIKDSVDNSIEILNYKIQFG